MLGEVGRCIQCVAIRYDTRCKAGSDKTGGIKVLSAIT